MSNVSVFAAFVNEVTRITITPDVIEASSDLRDLDPEQRNCLFPDEGDLKLLRNYSQVQKNIIS